MLVTTTPALPGRTYREIGLVVVAGPPLKKGPTTSYVVNAFLAAIDLIKADAVQQGGNAVIGVHAVIGKQFYVFMTGTVIWLDDLQIPAPGRGGRRAPTQDL